MTDPINEQEQRVLGVALDPEQLYEGDVVTVTVEAQMMDYPTGALLRFRNVVYRGVENDRLRFDSELGEAHRFSPFEIMRVELADLTDMTDQAGLADL